MRTKIVCGLIILVSGCGKSSSPATPAATASPATPTTAPAIPPRPIIAPSTLPSPIGKFDSADLVTAYIKNQVYADQNYTGKSIIVNGTIQRVGNSDAGTPFINVSSITMTDPNIVVCVFAPADSPTLSKLTQGQGIEVQGICGGLRQGNVIFSQCKLISH